MPISAETKPHLSTHLLSSAVSISAEWSHSAWPDPDCRCCRIWPDLRVSVWVAASRHCQPCASSPGSGLVVARTQRDSLPRLCLVCSLLVDTWWTPRRACVLEAVSHQWMHHCQSPGGGRWKEQKWTISSISISVIGCHPLIDYRYIKMATLITKIKTM